MKIESSNLAVSSKSSKKGDFSSEKFAKFKKFQFV